MLLMVVLLFSGTPICGANKFIVKDIRFDGLHRVGLMSALLSVPIKLGDVISNEDIGDVIRSLFSTGNFEDVCIFHDKDTLFIQVKECPTISNITFVGNRSVKQEALKKILENSGICIGEVLNRVALFNIEKELGDFYDRIGKYNTSIQTIITPMPYNCVILKLVFQEAVSTKIKRINILGNRIFKNEELTSSFRMKDTIPWWNVVRDCRYQQEKLIDDLKILNNYYLNRGYVSFNVQSSQIKLTPDKKNAYVTISVIEGNQYKISEVTVTGNLGWHLKEIKKSIKIKPGEVYNKEKISRIERDIKNFLSENGYVYPYVETQLKINDTNKTVKVCIHFKSGSRFFVRKILFEGNKITKDFVLRREIPQIEGAWVSSVLVNRGVERLNRSGYFETVSVDIRHVPNTFNQVDLVYKIKEQHTGSFNFGINYGTESGITFQVGIQQNNWLGTGYSLGIDSAKNNYQIHSDFSITNPYFTVKGVSAGARVFYNDFKADYADLSPHTNKSYGLDNMFGIPINEYNTFRATLGYIHNNLSKMHPQVAMWRYLDSMGKHFGVSSKDNVNFISNDFIFSYGWMYNGHDLGIFPTKGSLIDLSGKIAIPGSNNKYYKIALNTSSYFPIDEDHQWVILWRTFLGYGGGLRGKEMPFYENFYAGGSGTVRGFQSNNIGPKAVYYVDSNTDLNNQNSLMKVSNTDYAVGGNAISVVSLEFISPPPFVLSQNSNTIRTSLFVDAGTVWDSKWKNTFNMESNGIPDYSDPRNIRISTGISLQWRSPLGPLVFSYSYPIKKYNGDKIEKFQFNIGKSW